MDPEYLETEEKYKTLKKGASCNFRKRMTLVIYIIVICFTDLFKFEINFGFVYIAAVIVLDSLNLSINVNSVC